MVSYKKLYQETLKRIQDIESHKMKEHRQYLVIGYFVDYPDTYGDTCLLGEMFKNVSSASFVEEGTILVPEGVGSVAEKFFEEKGWKYQLAEVWVREKK